MPMNAYEVHKQLINTYVLQRRGDTALLKRDTSKDKRDIDVLRENHKFLWEDEKTPGTWEEQVAKRYYDKLFKEYCICDLQLYKQNKVALRWRIEKEVVAGKGQFSCAEKRCTNDENLRTWEVNFGYVEQNVKKNALVKLRLCPPCSARLNYYTKKREIKRLKKKAKIKHQKKKHKRTDGTSKEDINKKTEESKESEESSEEPEEKSQGDELIPEPWIGPVETTERTREEEIDDYLSNLLF